MKKTLEGEAWCLGNKDRSGRAGAGNESDCKPAGKRVP